MTERAERMENRIDYAKIEKKVKVRGAVCKGIIYVFLTFKNGPKTTRSSNEKI